VTVVEHVPRPECAQLSSGKVGLKVLLPIRVSRTSNAVYLRGKSQFAATSKVQLSAASAARRPAPVRL